MRLLKRIIDVLIAGLVLGVALPVLIAVGVGVWIDVGRPILFRQMRAGLGGREFGLKKFRTMHDFLDGAGNSLPDQARLTAFGRWLRRTSLDELPELWNVLAGEMSLVGPRPLLMSYNCLYSEKQLRRLLMPPGLTGWAVVNGRNSISWEEKFALDIWYVENWSIWLDGRILVLTVGKVLSGQGAEAGSECTMAAFTGGSDRGR